MLNDILKKRWAVVGFNYETAKKIILEIAENCGKEIKKKRITQNEIRIYFSDGTTLIWVRVSESSRGHKFGKMWADKSIAEEDIYHYVVLPCYYGEREDIIWI